MSQSITIHRYRRYRCAGEAHRARLRALLLPRLYPGALLPRHAWIGRWLGISASEAGRHLTRMLAEAGVETAVVNSRRAPGPRGWSGPKRCVVVAIPEVRTAA